jgi:hypothetical protein
MRRVTHQPDISEEAVLQATGRSWREWLGLLGGAGMAEKSREEMIVFLREQHGVPSWWQQSIANAFEQSISRASGDEADDGFQASVSRTVPLPAEAVFQAWIDGELRAKWQRRGDFEPSAIREPGTVRGKWLPDGSWLDVEVSAAAENSCELAIRHRKLADAVGAERMREFWERSVERMTERLGKSR